MACAHRMQAGVAKVATMVASKHILRQVLPHKRQELHLGTGPPAAAICSQTSFSPVHACARGPDYPLPVPDLFRAGRFLKFGLQHALYSELWQPQPLHSLA
jgi:hypothetical protein